jgi:hypothetical protein
MQFFSSCRVFYGNFVPSELQDNFTTQKTSYFFMSNLFGLLNFNFPAKSRLFAILFGAILLFLQACNETDQGYQPPTPDVSGIQVKATIRRFDKALFSLDTTRFTEGMAALQAQYPAFLPFFIQNVAHDQTLPSEKPEDALRGFVAAQQVRRLNDSCQARFPDLADFQKDMAQVLRYFKHYFPERREPITVTAVTEFIGDAFLVNDTTMMIGLDMFLGSNFEGYNPDIFPQYIRNQFTPRNMIVKYAFELANSSIAPPAKDKVLDHVVRNGKVLYLMDCLLPDMPDSTLMGYTKAELSGCFENEKGLWARLLEMKVLYEPLGTRNMKIVTAGPSTDNVFQEAPGQVGNWIGWQIVRAYMKRYPNTDFAELNRLTDAQQFLEKAKYKPRGQ